MNSQPVLSREEIESWRTAWFTSYSPVREIATSATAIQQLNTLCDMALASLDSGAVELRLAQAQEIAMALQRKLGDAEKTNAMLADNWVNTEKLLAKRCPEGYTLVPVTPTQAMLDAGGMMFPGSDPSYCNAGAQDIYGEMLVAAPPSTAKESLTVGGDRRNGDRRTGRIPLGSVFVRTFGMGLSYFEKKVQDERKADRRRPAAEPINAGAQGPDLTGQVQSVPVISPANVPSCEERLPEPQDNPAALDAAAPLTGAEAMRRVAVKWAVHFDGYPEAERAGITPDFMQDWRLYDTDAQAVQAARNIGGEHYSVREVFIYARAYLGAGQ